MTLAIILVVIATVAFVYVMFTGSDSRQIEVSNEIAPSIQPIDIEAFRNLTDPAENEYLRRRLPASEFRKVRRERLRAIAAYVRAAAQNATILTGLAQAALVASDENTAEAARQLVDNALLLHRNATFALVRIKLAIVWPSTRLGTAQVVHGYERLNISAMLLGRLQNPSAPVRIAS